MKRKSEIYETEIKAMNGEQRVEQFEMVRHGYGLHMFSGQRNEDGVITNTREASVMGRWTARESSSTAMGLVTRAISNATSSRW